MVEKISDAIASRSATATIRGYVYQFDLSILRILGAGHGTRVTVEGYEDVDLGTDTPDVSIQCKYLAAQDFTLPNIRDAVLPMVRAFRDGRRWEYRLYAHFRNLSASQPPLRLSLKDLKECLTEQKRKPEKRTILHYDGIDDSILANFTANFLIIPGPTFEEQQALVFQALGRATGDPAQDVLDLHYTSALARVVELAMQTRSEDRQITRAAFLSYVNKKPLLFDRWNRERLGVDKYLRASQLVLKKSGALAAVKRRGVVLDVADIVSEAESQEHLDLLKYLAANAYGAKSLTSALPWTVLLEGADKDIAEVKRQLATAGIRFNDGYESFAFNPAIFDEDPILNTRKNSSYVAKSSFAVRLLSAETYEKHSAQLKPLSTLISFGNQPPSSYSDPRSTNTVHAPSVAPARIISFIRGAQ